MKLNYSQTELQSVIQPISVEGSTSSLITGLASLDRAKSGDLSFLGNGKYKSLVPKTLASVVLVPLDYEGKPNNNQVYFKVQDPSLALSNLCLDIEKQLWPKAIPGIHSSAIIDPSAQVDSEASIGPLCTISANAKIGKNVVLSAGVHVGTEAIIEDSSILMPQSCVMDHCIIGKRVRLHSGAVIGSDGFGYQFDMGVHKKIPQVGIVVVEDDVEIGANTTVDRARFDATRIGSGTKIDNLVQIAHNVQIGKHCLIVSQAGIAGSTVLEDYVIVGGQVGIVGHVRIGRGAKIGSQSGVNEDIPPGSTVRGSPAYPYMQAQRLEIFKKRLPELFTRVGNIEEAFLEHQVK